MLKYSAWTIIFVVLTQTINGALQGLGKVNTPVIAFAIGAVIKLVLNINLIPAIGVKGAIISSIISSAASFIICLIVLKRNINLKFEKDKFLLKPLMASILMAITSYCFYNVLHKAFSNRITLILSLLLAVIIYIILLLCFKVLSKEEISMIPYGHKAYRDIKERKK